MAPGSGTVVPAMETKTDGRVGTSWSGWGARQVHSGEALLRRFHLRQDWRQVRLLVTRMPGGKHPRQSRTQVQTAEDRSWFWIHGVRRGWGLRELWTRGSRSRGLPWVSSVAFPLEEMGNHAVLVLTCSDFLSKLILGGQRSCRQHQGPLSHPAPFPQLPLMSTSPGTTADQDQETSCDATPLTQLQT